VEGKGEIKKGRRRMAENRRAQGMGGARRVALARKVAFFLLCPSYLLTLHEKEKPRQQRLLSK
jgi:hypothetical protein